LPPPVPSDESLDPGPAPADQETKGVTEPEKAPQEKSPGQEVNEAAGSGAQIEEQILTDPSPTFPSLPTQPAFSIPSPAEQPPAPSDSELNQETISQDGSKEDSEPPKNTAPSPNTELPENQNLAAEPQSPEDSPKDELPSRYPQRPGELEYDGSTYLWEGNLLYRRLSDGSLELADGFFNFPDSEAISAAQKPWLTFDEEGNVTIQVSLNVWATIYFPYNSDELTQDSLEILEVFGNALNRPALKNRKLLIIGHTDDIGTSHFNLTLSYSRADSVAKWLIDNSEIERDRLILTGYGDRLPIADNSTPEGQAQNRRVEFILLQ
jgi:outer membrane protein OmpA-like peptidoglycan-associated protein